MDGIDISVADAPTRSGRYKGPEPRKARTRFFQRHAQFLSFLAVVILPTLIASGYFVFFATYQYVSEAKFVVRGSNQQSGGGLSSLLQTAGLSRAADDTYAVQDYITSRDALAGLIKTEDLRSVFSRPEADRLSRFPSVTGEDTFEHFYRYYQSHVDVTLDSTTGVSSLTVKTFRPEDSERIATAVLNAGEQLINRMNARQRENAMRDARKEVKLAEERVAAIETQVAEFRNREALLDPNKQSIPMLQSINELETMLSRTNLQMSQLIVSSPQSPLIADYKRRIVALQGQINNAKVQITGTDSSLVPKITAYDMLTLQRQFADKQLSSATTSLEMARMQAERQELYLDPIVQPNLPDYAAYPKRLADLAIIFVTLLGVYLMGSLLIAGAREHHIV